MNRLFVNPQSTWAVTRVLFDFVPGFGFEETSAQQSSVEGFFIVLVIAEQVDGFDTIDLDSLLFFILISSRALAKVFVPTFFVLCFGL